MTQLLYIHTRGERINVDNTFLETPYKAIKSSWTMCLKNQPCDFIKMKEVRGDVGEKTHKK